MREKSSTARETIKGVVVEGARRGRELGFPTLNIVYRGALLGVFCAKVHIRRKIFPAAVHIGPRPTFNERQSVCEVHVIGWSGSVDLGTELEVEIFEKIREVERFPDPEALKTQLAKDVQYAKNWYTSHTHL